MATRLATLADVFGADLSAVWDARTLSLADGAAVASLPDSSVSSGARTGSTVDAAQSNASLRPTYSATGLNGYPAVVGNGSQYLDLSNVAGLPSGTNPVTVLMLAQGVAGAPVSNSVLLQWGSGSYGVPANNNWGQKNTNGPWWYTDYGGSAGDLYGTTSLSTPSLGIFIMSKTGTPNATLTVNGIQEYSVNPGAAPIGSNSGRLLYTTHGDCSPFTGKFGLLGVVRRIITDDERQKAEGIILWAWGLQANLPATHPYKAAAPTVAVNDNTPLRRRPMMLIAS